GGPRRATAPPAAAAGRPEPPARQRTASRSGPPEPAAALTAFSLHEKGPPERAALFVCALLTPPQRALGQKLNFTVPPQVRASPTCPAIRPVLPGATCSSSI